MGARFGSISHGMVAPGGVSSKFSSYASKNLSCRNAYELLFKEIRWIKISFGSKERQQSCIKFIGGSGLLYAFIINQLMFLCRNWGVGGLL